MTDAPGADTGVRDPVPPGLRLLVSGADLHARIESLAGDLRNDYEGRNPVLITVLKGATPFLADLVRAAGLDLEVDFMSISSYGAGQSASGVVRIEKDLSTDIAGRHVIVVEDIVDTGLTLNYLLRVLKARNPASLEVCSLLDKNVRRIVELPISYRGFSIPDEFVIGYGLDYEQKYRNIDAIYAVEDVSALVADPGRFAPDFFPPEHG